MIGRQWIAVVAACLMLPAVCAGGAFAAGSDPTAWTSLDKGTFGIGVGQGYGGIGMKYETAALGKSMTLVLAPGLTASNVGVKAYLPVGNNPGARNFFALRYGIQLTGINEYTDDVETWTGISIGFGRRWSRWEFEGGFRPQPSGFTAADEYYYGSWVPVYISAGYNF